MRLLKLALLCLCIIILSAASDGNEENDFQYKEETWKNKYNSIYKLVLLSEIKQGKRIGIFSATGFSVATKNIGGSQFSFILTNDHFCDQINETSFLAVENTSHRFINVFYETSFYEVVVSNPSYDMCLIKIPGYLEPIQILEDSKSLSIADKVVVIGAPGGDFPIILEGFISGKVSPMTGNHSLGSIKNDLILISLKIIQGHSGSPVLTQDGKVGGIIFAAYPYYGGLAISHWDIREFLSTTGIEFN